MAYKHSRIRNDYLTPPDFIQEILKENGLEKFDCDVCCTQFNVPATYHYTEDCIYKNKKICFPKKLIGRPWHKNNWCNPPFDISNEFVEKAAKEQEKGNTTYMLIPARTERGYWHDYILLDGKATRPNVEVTFLKHGLCFLDPDTGKPLQMKVKKKDGTFKFIDGKYKHPLALVIFRGVNHG